MHCSNKGIDQNLKRDKHMLSESLCICYNIYPITERFNVISVVVVKHNII